MGQVDLSFLRNRDSFKNEKKMKQKGDTKSS